MKIAFFIIVLTLSGLLQGCQESLVTSPSEGSSISQAEDKSSNIRGVTPPDFSGSTVEDHEKRYALLIGNATYKSNLDDLVTPAKDVADMERVLENSGTWEVDTLLNASGQQMEEKVSNFTNKHKGKTLLFFYTGHGTQVDNLSYLLPVGRQFNTGADVRHNALRVDYILDKFSEVESKMSVIILDACRDNILPTKGLTAPVFASTASLSGRDFYVIQAAQPGKVAEENKVLGNSYLTKYLMKAMNTHGKQSIGDLLAETSSLVFKATGGKQQPDNRFSSVSGKRFCMFGCSSDRIKTENPPLVKPTEIENSLPEPVQWSCAKLKDKIVRRGILEPEEDRFFKSSCGRDDI